MRKVYVPSARSLLALAALLVAGCVLVPVPVLVPIPVTPVPVGAGLLSDHPYVEVGPDGATFYEAPRWNGVVGGAAAGQMFPVTGIDSWGEWWQVEFLDMLVWAHESEVTVRNADGVPVVWP